MSTLVLADNVPSFLAELPATQASPSYDQITAYRNSLFTQAPARGPQFASKPVRPGAIGRERLPVSAHVSSSPTRDEPPDQYSMDSFLVQDDDNVFLSDAADSSGS